MIIFFLIFALFSTNPEGAPIDTSSIPQCRCDAVDIYLRDNPTNSHFGTRARNDIIVSCLATILACTWTTIHPNIPAPGESGWNQLKQKVVTWIYALLAPEAITAWAMRQYFGAQNLIENPLKKRSPCLRGLRKGRSGLGQSRMGSSSRWEGLSGARRESRSATTTEIEIQDRSKEDILSKTIVILQTTWFIAQCIARWSAHLPVTELEVVTLGFAMLNALTYGFWWHKPQSVGVPVFLETHMPARDEGKPAEGERKGEAGGEREQSMVSIDADACVQRGEDREASGREVACAVEGAREHSVAVVVELEAGEIVGEGTNVRWRTMWEGVKGFLRSLRVTHTAEVPRKEVPIEQRSFFIRQLAWDRKKHPQWQLVWRTPYALVLAVLRPLAKLPEFRCTEWDKWDLRVPMFNTAHDKDETVFVASSIIASFFGLVHFIPAWFLDFPSPSERILWRISAAIITGQPIIFGAWSKWTNGYIYIWNDDTLFRIAILSTVPLYILARLILLILACLSLRHLSSDQLITIEWISFVPHL